MAAASRSLQPPSPPGDEEEEAVVDVPSMVQIDVPHVQQIYHWDCGLACTKMVLRLLNIPFNDFNLIAQDLKFGTSVWTIDLANILAHYKVDHMFYTITLGVDEGYSNKSFYKKNFTSDERRINELFDSPAQLGISLQQGKVTLDDIRKHLATQNVAVFLIDWSKLDCRWCHRSCLSNLSFSCLSAYQGHYIVVVGYDTKENAIFYKNPSFKNKLCCCSMKTFENARKSYGTDEDAIFVYGVSTASDNLPS